MTPLEIRDTIINAVYASWDDTPVAYPNRRFDPENDAPNNEWLRVSWRMYTTVWGETSEQGVGYRNGMLFLDIFTELGKKGKHRQALMYSTKVERMFRRKTISNMFFDEAITDEIGPDLGGEPFYHVQTKIPFQTWVGE
jgi:hypothetical protein